MLSPSKRKNFKVERLRIHLLLPILSIPHGPLDNCRGSPCRTKVTCKSVGEGLGERLSPV